MPKKPALDLKDAEALIAKQEIVITSMTLQLAEAEKKLESAKMELRGLSRNLKATQKLITRDTLTGLLNERGGNEILSHHFSILQRDHCPKNNFAIMYLDLNGFKAINDTHGHSVGDEALKFFAEKIASVLREKYDIVVRMHGDEFLVVLPESNLEQATFVKEKIKGELTKNPFVFEKDKIKAEITLSTSIGIAMALDRRKVISVKQLIVRADKAMYKDKVEGKMHRS